MTLSMSARLCYQRLSTNMKTTLPINGVIFDMDGTLTIPVLKFQELRERLGISDEVDILDYANSAPDYDKPRIHKIIEDFEDEGNKQLQLKPSIHDLFYFLKREQLKTALLTRNNKKCVDSFIKRFIHRDNKAIFSEEKHLFSKIVTRDFLPTKPHPAPVHHICAAWKAPEETVLVVGDDWQDIECGNRAGSVTVLMTKPSNTDIKNKADFCIDDLSELVTLLQTNFTVKKD